MRNLDIVLAAIRDCVESGVYPDEYTEDEMKEILIDLTHLKELRDAYNS